MLDFLKRQQRALVCGSQKEQPAGRTGHNTVTIHVAERLLRSDAGITLAYASETGFIEDITDLTERDLTSAGIPPRLLELDDLKTETLHNTSPILFMVSTTGDGDPPFTAQDFDADVMTTSIDLSQLSFGLLAAGDTSYDTFCGFGHRLCQWLQANGAHPLFEPVYVDGEDERAIRQWRQSVIRVLAPDEASAARR